MCARLLKCLLCTFDECVLNYPKVILYVWWMCVQLFKWVSVWLVNVFSYLWIQLLLSGSIHRTMDPSIYYCINVPINASAYPSMYPFTHPFSIHLFTNPSMHPPTHLSIHPPIQPCFHAYYPSIHSSIYPSICPSIYPSMPSSNHPSIHLSTHQSIHPSLNPSIHSAFSLHLCLSKHPRIHSLIHV